LDFLAMALARRNQMPLSRMKSEMMR
jgi:hypothetical protein